MEKKKGQKGERAIFGGGCFWCLEALFQRVPGVLKVTPGYSGGTLPNPTYHQVSTGTTGYAEVVEVWFNPEEVSYRELVRYFFQFHDPTQLNRQGPDVGPQYRSIILYTSPEQRKIAMEEIARLRERGVPVVTEVKEFTQFWPAEEYHHNFYNRNRTHPYCYYLIRPKIEKFFGPEGERGESW
jgi:peptide-methionine (S)-S-oxide reductase